MPPNTHLNRQVGTPSSNPFFWNFTRCSASVREILFPSSGNCGTSCPPSPSTSLARTSSSEMGTGSSWRRPGDARRGVRSEGPVAEVAPARAGDGMSGNVHKIVLGKPKVKQRTNVSIGCCEKRRLERHRRQTWCRQLYRCLVS
jgi:hypothetical protein